VAFLLYLNNDDKISAGRSVASSPRWASRSPQEACTTEG
jgi:hypothetical protein